MLPQSWRRRRTRPAVTGRSSGISIALQDLLNSGRSSTRFRNAARKTMPSRRRSRRPWSPRKWISRATRSFSCAVNTIEKARESNLEYPPSCRRGRRILRRTGWVWQVAPRSLASAHRARGGKSFWQQYFGVGLVKTVEDFGVQGERPSHPNCLTGGDRIHPLRLGRETLAAGDRDFRHLPAVLPVTPGTAVEGSRESFVWPAVPASGSTPKPCAPRLVCQRFARRNGGRSQRETVAAPGLWEAVSYNNVQKYVPDTDAAQYRRSLYIYWKRQSRPRT